MKRLHVFAVGLACWLPAIAPVASAIELPLASGRVTLGVSSIKQLRFAATLRQQYDFSCGSAALATLLTHHYARPVTEQQVFEQMYLRGDQPKIRKEGFSLLDMQRYLAALGYRADGFELPLDKLLDAGLPAIVLVAERGYQHFVVIKGASAGRVLLGDPAGGTRAMPRERFESIWRNKLLFVIHSHAEAAAAHRPDAKREEAKHEEAKRLAVTPLEAHRPAFNRPEDWRAAPHFPLAEALRRDSAADLSLSKLGPGDF